MLTYSTDSAVVLTIDFDRFDCENMATGAGRWNYRCQMIVDDETLIEDDTLRSGTTNRDNPPRLAEMLSTFLSFLGTFAEASDDGENADLFPAATREACQAIGSDTFALWADEIVGEQ